MKNSEILLFLGKNGIKIANHEEVCMKLLKSRKKLLCIYATCNDKPIAIFYSKASSRILKKEFEILDTLVSKLESLKHSIIDKKVYIYASSICSKALKIADETNWKALHVSM